MAATLFANTGPLQLYSARLMYPFSRPFLHTELPSTVNSTTSPALSAWYGHWYSPYHVVSLLQLIAELTNSRIPPCPRHASASSLFNLGQILNVSIPLPPSIIQRSEHASFHKPTFTQAHLL